MQSLNKKFRTDKEIIEIKQYSSPPKCYQNYMSTEEILWLNDIHANLDKNLMTDAYRNSFRSNNNTSFFQEISTWAKGKFNHVLGDFNISSFFFYESPKPESATDATIHTDVWDDETIVDKTILIPLIIEPKEDTHTIIFNQHYYHYGAAYAGQVGNKQKFGPTVILPEHYNKIDGLQPTKEFDKNFYFDHLTHKPYANLYGLSVSDIIKWQPGNVIIFDRTQLHCCDNYFNVNTRAWFAIWSNKGKSNGTKSL